jgi:hypothetical protein
MKQSAAAAFAFIEPMKALRVTALPVGDWLYELKFDGYIENTGVLRPKSSVRGKRP